MYTALQQEIDNFVKRTPKSAEAHKKNLKRIPLGVASNYRAYDPWPIFVKDASGDLARDTRRCRSRTFLGFYAAFMRPRPNPSRRFTWVRAIFGRVRAGTGVGGAVGPYRTGRGSMADRGWQICLTWFS